MRLLFSIIFAIFCTIAALASRDWMTTLLGLAIAFTPLGLTIRRIKARRALMDALYAAACSAVGVPLTGAQYAHREGDTLIVLNPVMQRIALSAGGASRVYDYADVRAWRAQKVSRAGMAVGSGLTGTVAAGSANIGASIQADAQTGLFMTMRDVEHAVWRISMFDSADRDRWSEILRQQIDERRAAG